MCKRCDAVDAAGHALAPTVTLECSWCDEKLKVCKSAADMIAGGGKAGLCDAHHAELMGKRIGDFGYTNSGKSDEERDVDANGWLSNALRLLEEPEER